MIAPVLAGVSPEIAVAIIAAAASVVGALVTGFLTRRNNAALKKLEEAQDENKARISYNYEARKRLYTVCEPLLFQAMEGAEEARARISGLAKAASRDQLCADGSGWLSSHEYYFKSTVYGLLAPITTFNILQRRLTTIDLGLDTDVRAKYEMLKLIFFSFTNDWRLAEWGDEGTRLEYDRNKADPGEPDRERLLREQPERYAPQGLYRGMIYVVAEALISSAGEPGGSESGAPVERCMTFGEFQREWDRVEAGEQCPLTPVSADLVDLFSGFHPLRKPVLWRLLIGQYLLYRALSGGDPRSVPLSEEEEIDAFDWRSETHQAEDFRVPVRVATAFVDEQLASLRQRLPQ